MYLLQLGLRASGLGSNGVYIKSNNLWQCKIYVTAGKSALVSERDSADLK